MNRLSLVTATDVQQQLADAVRERRKRMKLSRRLYEARKQLCRDHNIERIIIGGRIPGYSQHAASLSASEYVERVITKALYDPVLTAQISNGFALQGLSPNYLPTDGDSRGCWRDVRRR